MGVKANTMIAKCFFEIWPTEKIDITIAEAVLAKQISQQTISDIEEENVIMDLFKNIIERFVNINVSSELIPKPEREVETSPTAFCKRLCTANMKNVLMLNVKR